MQKKNIVVTFVIIALVAGSWWLFGRDKQPNTNNTGKDGGQSQQTVSGFDKMQHPVGEPGSIWWVVNKERPLPAKYVPSDLLVPDVRLRLGRNAEQMRFSSTAADELKAMFADAAADGITLVFGSGYRSYELQKQFYDSYVANDGQEAADHYSARPGTSEHQTGLSFDATNASETCHLEVCFKETPEGKWLAEHAHEYGFIIRYLEGKETVTGYQYEPWHFRYVGDELASELKKTNQTMEEFFDL
jgi:zinc D-Ala-D-Ala carboxypeptidase